MRIRAAALSLLFVLPGLCLSGCPYQGEGLSEMQMRGMLSVLIGETESGVLAALDSLEDIAQSEAAASGGWAAIKPLLESGMDGAFSGLAWFALADGSYYTLADDLVEANLSDRAYWPDLEAGSMVMGAPVTGKTSGRPSAVFAVPVFDGEMFTGAAGYSIYLDNMVLALVAAVCPPRDMAFFILNDDGVNMGDSSDLALIFDEPAANPDAPQSLRTAAAEMLAHSSGETTYTWQNVEKTVCYQRSKKLGWRFAVAVPVAE
jgi:hypothetical protein